MPLNNDGDTIKLLNQGAEVQKLDMAQAKLGVGFAYL